MTKFIKTTLKTYFRHFWLFIKLMSPLLIPMLLLRLIGHFAYLDSLTVVYSVIFGLILGITGIFIEIKLIQTAGYVLAAESCDHTQTSGAKPWAWRDRKLWHSFLPYVWLKIMITATVLIIPFALKYAEKRIDNVPLSFGLNVLGIGWLVSSGFLLLFATYSFVLEGTNAQTSLKRSLNLMLKNPFQTVAHLLLTILIVGFILIVLSALTSVIIAAALNQTALLFNPYLSPWWQKLVIDIYTVLGAPAIVIAVTILFNKIRHDT